MTEIRALTVLATLSLLLASCVPDPGRAERAQGEYLRIVEAEDARPLDGPRFRTLVDGTRHDLAFIRRTAVRALGRLERPDLVEHIAPLIRDPSPVVRRSAVNAVAQAFYTTDDASEAAGLLLPRVDEETDPSVRGTLARSLGRLSVDGPTRRRIEGVLVAMSRFDGRDAPQETMLGVALGLESLIRQNPADEISSRTVGRLAELTVYPTRRIGDPDPSRIRTLALNALGIAGHMTFDRIRVALADVEPQPGATAARYVGSVVPLLQDETIRRIIASPLLHTVLQGFVLLQEEPATDLNCRYMEAGTEAALTEAIRAPIGALAVAAYDRPCPDLGRQQVLLDSVASVIDTDPTPWQTSARALVSLAAVGPDRARRLMPRYVSHSNPFVRAYAAEAATLLGDAEMLRALARDEHPNVRTAALPGLFAIDGHAVDPLLLDALDSDDPQLLLTAARLLDGSPDGAAADAALDAFVRISKARRETWRDPRRALLGLLMAEGRPDQSETLEPYLRDYDPMVANDVAALLGAWTGRAVRAAPEPPPRAEIPTVAELRAMDGAVVRLHMEDGGVIDIALDPYLATTNAYRFYRLVREGYFDGLTFHRWAPNFVLQGGSPGANEYQGAGAFSRDEVGLESHWRGTVGISTRGHDTGDGQIFINLLDNVRLDHTYTVIGSVVDGMNTVALAMDGVVIERAEILSP